MPISPDTAKSRLRGEIPKVILSYKIGMCMRQAVIVSTARTPIGKAYRGAFNNTTSPTLAAFAIKGGISKAGVEPGEEEDVIMGASLQQGGQGFCLGRQSVLASILPSAAGSSRSRWFRTSTSTAFGRGILRSLMQDRIFACR